MARYRIPRRLYCLRTVINEGLLAGMLHEAHRIIDIGLPISGKMVTIQKLLE